MKLVLAILAVAGLVGCGRVKEAVTKALTPPSAKDIADQIVKKVAPAQPRDGYTWVLLCADHSEVSLNAPHYWIPTKEEQEDACRKHGGVAKEIHVGNVVSNIDPLPSHEAQVYAELWRVCKEKHLSYQVQFGFEYLGDHYIASAWDKDFNFWNAWGNGPTEAAENLIKQLNGPPDHPKGFDTGEIRP